MKRFALILSFALFAISGIWAGDIDEKQALQIAGTFAVRNNSTDNQLKTSSRDQLQPQLAHTVLSASGQKNNVFVINLGGDQGFVLVSGVDNTETDILGWCDHGSFNYDTAPVQLKDMLDGYSQEIDRLRLSSSTGGQRKVSANASDEWIVVAPLLKTTWNQGAFFNLYCPDLSLTGCTNTALAQIMYYWHWPKQAREYVDIYGENIGATTVYDWDTMPLSEYSTGSFRNLAQLMFDIGHANYTVYTPSASYASPNIEALIDVFSYSTDCRLIGFTYPMSLADSLKKELSAGRPVWYSGHPKEGDGHALVCDGFTIDDFFHFNFGWGGDSDGYYKLGQVGNFNLNPRIIMGMFPSSAFTVEQGNMRFACEDNGEATVTRITTDFTDMDNPKNFTIPDEIEVDGKTYPVTSIGKSAFARGNNSYVDTLTMGRNIRSIGPFGFSYLTINTLILNDSLRVIGERAFINSKVRNLTIGSSPISFGKESFYLCLLSNVTCNSPSIDIGERALANTNPDCGQWLGHIRSLGYRALYCTNLSSATPDFSSIEIIGPQAFIGTIASTVKLGAHLKQISPTAFHNTTVRNLDVDPNNPYYSSFGSISKPYIFTRDSTTMVAYIAQTGAYNIFFSFPRKMVRIDPEVVPTHSSGSFYIPNTVVEMNGAFKNCEKLTTLYCLAANPPVITDDTFNDKMFNGNPTLYVPEGSVEAYRNAPGWRRFKNISVSRDYQSPAPEIEREHYMLTHRNDSIDDGTLIPVSQIEEMSVSADGKVSLLMRNASSAMVCDALNIDSITWQDGFLFGADNVFPLDENHLTAQIRECSITFDPTVIDSSTQVCIREILQLPDQLPNAVNAKAIDISLANGVHQLTGTATITIHLPCDADHLPAAAWFDETQGKWEPIPYEYNTETESVEILTSHLSTFAAFTIQYENTAYERIRPLDEYLYPYNLFSPYEVAANLQNIICKSEDDSILWDTFKDTEALWQQYTIDGGLNAILGCGLKSDWLSKFQEGMGYLGLAINICDLLRAEWKGDEQAIVNTAISSIVNQATNGLVSAFSTPILTASMGVVAFVGIALNKFGTTVQQQRGDLFRDAYHLFYERNSGCSKQHYRSATEWFNMFYPMFQKPITKDKLYAMIDNIVIDYCDDAWKNLYSDDWTFCLQEAHKSYPWTWDGGLNQSLKQTLSEEFRSELYNGVLTSVFIAIRKHMLEEREKQAIQAQKDFLDLMNKVVRVRFKDSSYNGTSPSRFAGCTLRMDGVPSTMKDKEKWQTVINEKGEGQVLFSTYTYVRNLMPGRFFLVEDNGDETMSYEFQLPASRRGEKWTNISIDLNGDGKPADNPRLKGLCIMYDPDTLGFRQNFVFTETDNKMVSSLRKWSRRTHTIMVAEGDSTGCFAYRAGHEIQSSGFTMRTNIHAAVAQYFADHKTIVIDSTANKVRIGKDLTGEFDILTGEGYGTFAVNVSLPFVEQTIEHYNRPGSFYFDDDQLIETKFNSILEGTMSHTLTGNFTVVGDPVTHTCQVSFVADGNWALEALVADTIETDNIAGNATLTRKQPFNVLTTRTDHFNGKAHLDYSTKMAIKPED